MYDNFFLLKGHTKDSKVSNDKDEIQFCITTIVILYSKP